MFASLFNSVWKKSSNQWVVFLSPSYFWSSKKKTRGSLFSLLEVFFCVLKTQLATRSCTKIRGFRLTLFRRSQRKTFVPPFHESRGIVMVTVVFALLSQLSLGGGGLARCLDVWAKMVDDLISLEVQPPFFLGPVALRTIIFYYVRFSTIQKGPPFFQWWLTSRGYYNGSFWLVGIINSLLVSINQDAMGWHRSVSEVLHLRNHVRGQLFVTFLGWLSAPFKGLMTFN